MKMVCVEWVDSSFAESRWCTPDEEIEPVTVRSVGFVHRRDKRRIVLVGGVTKAGQVGPMFVIPRRAITKIRRLR